MLTDKDKTNKKIDLLIQNKATFTVKRMGGSTTINYMGKSFKTRDMNSKIAGCHLSQIVWRNIDERVESGLYVPINKDNSRIKINNVMIDPANTVKFIGKRMKSIDINSCYFNTARIIGAIDDVTHQKGFMDSKGVDKSKDWKNARNISIGSLGARTVEERYVMGKLVKQNGCFSKLTNREYNVIRLDIIDHVWQVANKISKKLKNGFAFYLTDAFCVEESYADDVIRMLQDEGYESKVEELRIKHFYQSNKLSSGLYYLVWDKWKIGDEENKEIDKRILFNKNKFVSWKNWNHWSL